MENKFTTCVLFFVLLFCLPNVANAQFGNLLKKVKKVVKKEITSPEKTKKESKPTKTEKPVTTKQTQSKTEEPVTQKKETASNPKPVVQKTETTTVVKKQEKKPVNEEHEHAVFSFLIEMADANGFLGGWARLRPLSYYKETLGVDLEDAIYVIHDEGFTSQKALDRFYEFVKSPKYRERRYLLTDHRYKTEIEFRKKYPNKRTEEYGNTKEHYKLYKFIKKYLVKDDPDFNDEIAYAKKKSDKLDKMFKDRLNAIAINDVHKANLYKIVFTSNRNINPKTAPASAYKTTFKPSEEIFGVAMVDKPLNRAIIKQAYPQLEMVANFNDRSQTVVEYQMFPIKPNQKYFVFPIVVKSRNFKCSNTEATANTEYGMRWLSKKEDRRFKIKVWLKEGGDYHNSSASLKGTFTYDSSDIGGAIVKKMANQVAAKCGRQ